jgi:hypothetical protein
MVTFMGISAGKRQKKKAAVAAFRKNYNKKTCGKKNSVTSHKILPGL